MGLGFRVWGSVLDSAFAFWGELQYLRMFVTMTFGVFVPYIAADSLLTVEMFGILDFTCCRQHAAFYRFSDQKCFPASGPMIPG